MNIKHTAEIRQRLTTKDGRILEERVQPATEFSDFSTMWSLMYNALGVSGGVRWRHPGTGEILQTPQITTEVVNPDDILVPGQLCDCNKCLAA